MEKEQEAAKAWADMKKKKADALGTVMSKRAELLEAQKKLAMLEVTALNHARMQELEAKKKAAMEAAAAAKANLLEQKQKQKEALKKSLPRRRQRSRSQHRILSEQWVSTKKE